MEEVSAEAHQCIVLILDENSRRFKEHVYILTIIEKLLLLLIKCLMQIKFPILPHTSASFPEVLSNIYIIICTLLELGYHNITHCLPKRFDHFIQ